MKPLCFVLMPFGKKKDESGRVLDFDCIYSEIIKPAVADANLEAIRADEEMVGGIIHKPMFERLMLCPYAVVDLTTANPNVLYELGIRHAIRPHSTVIAFAKGMRLPFDVAPLRGIPYGLCAKKGVPSQASVDRKAIADRLVSCRDAAVDSPLFQLVDEWPKPELAHLRTDLFREAVQYSEKFKQRLAEARVRDRDAVFEIEADLNLKDADPAIIVDLFLSYRAVSAWQDMVRLSSEMPVMLARTVLIQEQLGLAMNRLGRREDAQRTLEAVIEGHGPSSETSSLLGRVWKDRWDDAVRTGRTTEAKGYLRRAIECYQRGFEADWRDAYPGINALTLMELEGSPATEQQKLLPVVRYSARRRVEIGTPEYWDYATLLELEVLARDRNAAEGALADALSVAKEKWQLTSTARNLRMIRDARAKRGIDVAWEDSVVAELEAKGR